MANTDRKSGFTPVSEVGSGITAHQEMFFVSASDSSALFLGDIVSAGTQTSTNNSLYLPTVTIYTTGTGTTMGVVSAIDPIIAYQGSNVGLENLIRLYRPASTAAYAHCYIDPLTEYECGVFGASAIAISNLTYATTYEVKTSTAGSTITGLSGMQLDSGTTGTSTYPLVLKRFSRRVGVDPSLANPLAVVVLHTMSPFAI